MFRYPSKFLNEDDERLGKPLMRKKYNIVNEEIQYEKDENGNDIYVNVCNFYKKDDDIKFWSKQPEIMNAFIHIIFNHYGKKTSIPETMREEMNDFQEEEKEEDRFLDLFNFYGDKDWEENRKDWVSIAQINVLLKKAQINLSAQKYKNYLLSRGAVKGKKLNEQTNKREYCWVNLQVNEYKVKQMAEGYAIDSDEE